MSLPKLFTSSVNSEKLGLSVRGILIGIIPFLLLVASWAGVELAQGELSEIVEAISAVVISAGGALSAVVTLAGLVRKIAVKFR